jgi:hypothetical protein
MTAASQQTPSRPQAVLRAVASYARERFNVRVRHVSIDGPRVTLWVMDPTLMERRFGVATVEDDSEGVKVVDVEIVRPKRRTRGGR